MTSRTHDNFRHNFWTWVDPPPPFEQCSKKLHFFERGASLSGWVNNSTLCQLELGAWTQLRLLLGMTTEASLHLTKIPLLLLLLLHHLKPAQTQQTTTSKIFLMVGSKIVEILTALNAKKEGVLRQERVISQTMSVLSKNKMGGERRTLYLPNSWKREYKLTRGLPGLPWF